MGGSAVTEKVARQILMLIFGTVFGGIAALGVGMLMLTK